jgi:hypothetical protein
VLNADETLAALGLSRVNTATLARRESQELVLICFGIGAAERLAAFAL